MEKLSITLDNGQNLTISASFGLVVMAANQSVDAMLKDADQALHRAKQNGRNRVEF